RLRGNLDHLVGTALDGVRRREPARLDGRDQGQVNRENAADSGLALQPDLAAEQAGELAADRKAEAGASVLTACRAVRLGERLKDRLLLLEGDADPGVDDPECQHPRGAIQAFVGGTPAADR